MNQQKNVCTDAPISIDTDQFLRELIRELASALEEAVGLNADGASEEGAVFSILFTGESVPAMESRG